MTENFLTIGELCVNPDAILAKQMCRLRSQNYVKRRQGRKPKLREKEERYCKQECDRRHGNGGYEYAICEFDC